MHFWWEGLVDVGGNVDGGGDLSKPMDNGAAKDRVLQRLPALPHPLSGSCLVHAASRGLWPDQQHFFESLQAGVPRVSVRDHVSGSRSL